MTLMIHGLIEILLQFLKKLEHGLQKEVLVLLFWKVVKLFGCLKEMDSSIFIEVDLMEDSLTRLPEVNGRLVL